MAGYVLLRHPVGLLRKQRLRSHYGAYVGEQCSFSNGGHQFAAVQGNVIQIYSTVTYDVLVNLKGHNNRVRAVVWTDNDAELVSCGADGAVYEWNLATSRRVSENVIKQCQYNGVAVTKDMRSIVAVGSESIKEITDSQVPVHLLLLVAWRRGRTSVFDRRTFHVLRSTCS